MSILTQIDHTSGPFTRLGSPTVLPVCFLAYQVSQRLLIKQGAHVLACLVGWVCLRAFRSHLCVCFWAHMIVVEMKSWRGVFPKASSTAGCHSEPFAMKCLGNCSWRMPTGCIISLYSIGDDCQSSSKKTVYPLILPEWWNDFAALTRNRPELDIFSFTRALSAKF